MQIKYAYKSKYIEKTRVEKQEYRPYYNKNEKIRASKVVENIQ